VPHLSEEQTSKLNEALRVISTGIDGDEYFDGRALFLAQCVSMSGILSIPSLKPKDAEEIMKVCESLQRYLDRESTKP
jgi:hypothetical protein